MMVQRQIARSIPGQAHSTITTTKTTQPLAVGFCIRCPKEGTHLFGCRDGVRHVARENIRRRVCRILAFNHVERNHGVWQAAATKAVDKHWQDMHP